MCSVRTYGTYEKMLCPNVRFTRAFDVLVQNDVTLDNVIGLNLGYPGKYVFCPNISYKRKCAMSEHMLHTNTRCILSELMLNTEMYYVRTYVTHENIMTCVRTNDAYEKV